MVQCGDQDRAGMDERVHSGWKIAARKETVNSPHICDDDCVCPVHQTPLYYAPAWDDHACQDIGCTYGHGFARAAGES